MYQFYEEIEKIFDVFQRKNAGFRLIPIGSFLTNSLRKNKGECDIFLVNENCETKEISLKLWEEEISRFYRKKCVFDLNQEKFLKVFIEKEENSRNSFNFYLYDCKNIEKKQKLMRSLTINQEFLRFFLCNSHEICEEMRVLRGILKNWGYFPFFI